MELDPAYTPVGSLFDNKPMFFIPKYQRAYAWEAESVKDFIKDLKTCFYKRKSGSPVSHFFGGILSVEYRVQGVARQHEYEIIDGQQRVTTFSLLMACIVKIYKELEEKAKNLGDTDNQSILEGRIESLYIRFIEFNQEIQRNIKTVEVLRLSKPDQPFYRDLIRDRNPSPSRDSHSKLSEAYRAILKEVREMIDSSTLVSKMDDLEVVQNVMDSDFSVLHMVTKTRDDAFRLFQVINDRGTSLTEGDLLRAKTLEILEGFDSEQNSVEDLWNEILADPPSKTENYLHWIYESQFGKRAPQNALFDNFLDGFFPQHKKSTSSLQDAKNICTKVHDIHEDISKCRKLVDGQWLYPEQQPVTGWDRNRLTLLLKELDHTLSIPLLLAASKLNHRSFSEIVHVLERAFFRYKIICNQHAGSLQKIYREEAIAIRQNPSSYNTATLKQKLQNLIDSKASDKIFKSNLETLQYKESGAGSNKPLKYLLITIEYYYQWYKQGAVGNPVCIDKSRIYDFAGTSIEHIYPRNARAGSTVYNPNLEHLKNTLGNLTILDPAQNSSGGDDDFSTKRINVYQKSSVEVTKEEVGKKTAWTLQEIEVHKELLIDIALKVFRPKIH